MALYLSYVALSSSSPKEGACGFNADLTENRNRLRVFPGIQVSYKLLPLFDGLCHTSLPTFFLSSIMSEFVHDEASGFDRHYTESV